MKILVVNCGSSSLKFQFIDSEKEEVLAKGVCERIGIDGTLTYAKEGHAKETVDKDMPTHTEAIRYVLDALMDSSKGVIKSFSEVDAVGHRVVHGGEKFTSSVLIDDAVIDYIKECSDLAPLHNPANLIGIEACKKIMPDVPMVAVFDTAFHQTMPKKAYMYGIPLEYYDKYLIRRYGFHGTSHSYVSKKAAELIGKPYEESRLIVCHLGGGASVSAISNGRCIDTSMGLTPLEGLVMGTRSGNIDPSIIEVIAHKENKSIDDILHILNKESGIYALSGNISSDIRDIEAASKAGNEKASLAIEIFCYSIAKYIGAYFVALNGADAIAFTAGIGENDSNIRAKICSYLECLGCKVDDKANDVHGEEDIISTADSKVKLLAIPTNEELAIARETVALVK